jgi:hypothetical protein
MYDIYSDYTNYTDLLFAVMKPRDCLNVINIFFYTKMEYYMFSNEIHMEYVWNIQVPIVN